MSLAVQVAGALAVLVGFALLQLKRVTPHALPYLLLNAAGSAALAGSAAVNRQWGFVLLNTVWLAVSLLSLARRRQG